MSALALLPSTPVDRLESEWIDAPEFANSANECPLRHQFAPGVYLRTIFMRAGLAVVGHEHRTEHLNIVYSGKARVLIDGKVSIIEGPCAFVSKPGVRKVLHILEDMVYSTVHPTDETDIQKLEDAMVVKSDVYISHHEKRLLSIE